MAKEQPSQKNFYIIPDNFIDEGRILNGWFKTRYFIEAVILGLIAIFFAMMIPVQQITTRVTVIVIVAGPFFLLGITGIAGDPVSVAVKNVLHWLKTRTVMLYDNKPRVLVSSPLDKMMSQTIPKDQILDYIEKVRQERLERRIQLDEFVEGETFRFLADRDYTRDYYKLDNWSGSQAEDLVLVLDDEDSLEVAFDEAAPSFAPVPVISSDNFLDPGWDDFSFLDSATITTTPETSNILDFYEDDIADGTEEFES